MKHITIAESAKNENGYDGGNLHLVCDMGIIVSRKGVEPVSVISWRQIDRLAGKSVYGLRVGNLTRSKTRKSSLKNGG